VNTGRRAHCRRSARFSHPQRPYIASRSSADQRGRRRVVERRTTGAYRFEKAQKIAGGADHPRTTRRIRRCIERAIQQLRSSQGTPSGLLRINVSRLATSMLIEPRLAPGGARLHPPPLSGQRPARVVAVRR
jgi:hypothetical protein